MKYIKKIVIGVISLFVLYIALSVITNDDILAYQISVGIYTGYFILLSIISYIKNICNYMKTGQFPDNSWLVMCIIAISGLATNGDVDYIQLAGAHEASTRLKKQIIKLV